MKISLKKFSKYKRIIQNIIKKYNPLTESLYFNIQDGYCHFQNEEVFGKLKIEKSEEEGNLFINAEKFLILSSNLDELDLRDKTFYDNNDSFQLGNYGELSYEVPSYDNYEEYTEYDNLIQNKELFNIFREAFHYINKTEFDPYNAIFISNNSVMATEGSRVYIKQIEDIANIQIQESLMKILLFLDDSDQVKFKKLEDKILLIINNECEIIINANTNLKVPSIFSSKEFYDHETYIKCDLKSFSNLIQFLLPFTNSDSYNKLYLKVENNKILMSIKEEDINIKKYIDIVDSNLPDSNYEYLLCCTDLKLLLTHLEGQELKIQLSPDKVIKDRYALLSFSSFQDETKKIILPTLEG